MNIVIEFNKEIIERLKRHQLYVDNMGSSLFILFALYEKKFSLLDEFDDSNKERRAIILYRQLERKGMIEKSEGKYLYKISSKGNAIVEWVKSKFKEPIEAETFIEPSKEKESIDWIEEYIELFPKQFRDSKIDVLTRMREFMDLYKYDKDLILKATRTYIKEQEFSKSGHEYTMRSMYFVLKGRGRERTSRLASECERAGNAPENTFDTSHMDSV